MHRSLTAGRASAPGPPSASRWRRCSWRVGPMRPGIVVDRTPVPEIAAQWARRAGSAERGRLVSPDAAGRPDHLGGAGRLRRPRAWACCSSGLVRLRQRPDRPPRLRVALSRPAPGGEARPGQGARLLRAEPEPGVAGGPGRRPSLGTAGRRPRAGGGAGASGRGRPAPPQRRDAPAGSRPWPRCSACSARSSRRGGCWRDWRPRCRPRLGPALAAALTPLTAGVALAILALVAYDGLTGRVETLAGLSTAWGPRPSTPSRWRLPADSARASAGPTPAAARGHPTRSASRSPRPWPALAIATAMSAMRRPAERSRWSPVTACGSHP